MIKQKLLENGRGYWVGETIVKQEPQVPVAVSDEMPVDDSYQTQLVYRPVQIEETEDGIRAYYHDGESEHDVPIEQVRVDRPDKAEPAWRHND